MAVPDLFADSTMSFGEHLEALRAHLFRCVIYLLVACIPAAYLAEDVLDLATAPINAALEDYVPGEEKLATGDEIVGGGFWDNLKKAFSGEVAEQTVEQATGEEPIDETPTASDLLVLRAPRGEVRKLMEGPDDEIVTLALRLTPEQAAVFSGRSNLSNGLVSNELIGPFMIYIKAILVTAFAFASPGIFWELWMFVGAGLYPHERKYVYLYLPISLGLFFAGAAFCFTVVFQFVLPFLLSFNDLVETVPLIDASKWFSFALMLPAMFGLSFQLPLVMLALNRLGIIESEFYRANVRMAILVIAGISVLMTPSDPGSMLAMMIPLVGLYFVGIWMCEHFPTPGVESPFGEEAEEHAKIEA
ncbi:twin-arginine translocase subunit TatC [Alienimonas sp. DA493]|uniref:twin-arginine translocase subunit TatC n=1 Tax=Alienimonas sp. DA493 TaxID=3373605 RepID=UPI0037546101